MEMNIKLLLLVEVELVNQHSQFNLFKMYLLKNMVKKNLKNKKILKKNVNLNQLKIQQLKIVIENILKQKFQQIKKKKKLKI
jgi:hypothetical protein